MEGYCSGLEDEIAAYLKYVGVPFKFEAHRLPYQVPARDAKYTPDFFLSNGIIIESKGRFVTADRQKMILVKKQHPLLDIRFVFNRSKDRISKRSNTTYAMWCDKNRFPYADKLPPVEWLNEPPNEASIKALQEIINGTA